MKKKMLSKCGFVQPGLWPVVGVLLSLFMVVSPLKAQIDINLTPTSPSCNAYTDGMVQSQVSGGVQPYSYIWSNGQSTVNLYGVGAGTYTLNVTDVQGNSASAEVTVTEPDALLVEIGVVGNVCLGTQGSLQAVVSGGTPPYEIIWDNGIIGVTNDNLHEGANSVNVTDDNGCFDNALVIVSLPMSIELITTDVACGGGCDGSVEVVVTGGQGPFTYLWDNGETGPVLQNVEAGEFCVTVTDALGCSLNDCAIVGEPTSVEVSLDIVYDEIECGETVTATASVTVTGGDPPYTITWSNGATGPVVTGLTPGSYSVNVVDQSGCGQTINFKIEKPPVLTCSIDVTQPDCLGGTTGSATVSGMGGTPPYAYLWSNGATTPNVDDLAPGNYTVTVSDDIGCEAVCYATINETGTVGFFLTPTDAVCGMNGSITVTVTDGDAPFDISWNGPQSGSITTSDNPYTITGLVPGEYMVTVGDDNGCTGTRTVRINDSGRLRFQVTPEPEVCGGENGSILVTVTVGTPDYRVEWTGPASGAVNDVGSPYTITDLPSGDYTVTVIDANGCFESHNTTVGSTDYDIPLTIDTICVGATGNISVSWSAGEAPYTLEWSGPNGQGATVDPATSPFELSGLMNGNYAFTVTDVNGCDGTGDVNLNCEPPPCNLACTTTSTPAICDADNGTITVTVTGANGPVTVTVNSATATVVDNMDGTFTISGLTAGDYEVTVTDDDDPNCQTTCSATVGQETYDLDPMASLICVDSLGTITVTWSVGEAPYTLEWSGPGGQGATVDPATSPFVLPDLTNGSYAFTVTDNLGCDGNTNISVVCPPDTCELQVTASTTPAICEAENGTITVNVSNNVGPYSITLTPGITVTGITDPSYTFTGLAPGDYSILVVDSIDCSVMINVTVGREDTDLGLTVTDDCNGSLGTVTVGWQEVDGTPPFILEWTDPANNPFSDTVNTSPYILEGLVLNGTYSFTVTDANICMDTASVEVMCPDCNIFCETTSTPSICEADNGTITVDVMEFSGSYSISWSGPENGSGSSSTSPFEITGLPPGDYIIEVVDEENCATNCAAVVEQEIEDVLVSAEAVCDDGLDTGTITVSWTQGTAPYTLIWTGPNNQGDTIAPATSPVVLSDLADNGLYTFTVIDTFGCVGSTSRELECPPCPLTCTASSTPAQCLTPNGTITVNVSDNQGAYSITIDPPGTTIADLTDPSYTFTDLAAGTYLITVTDTSGCMEIKEVIVEQEIYDIPVTASLECQDSIGTITVSWSEGVAPYALTWVDPNGITTGPITVVSPFSLPGVELNGLYTFTVTDSLGCDGTVDILVECPPPCPLTCTAEVTPAQCQASNGTITVTVSGNQGPYALTIDPPGTTIADLTDPTYTFTDLAPGDYTITVTDTTGCMEVKTVVVDQEIYDIPLTVSAECGDSTGTITVSWSVGAPPFELSWLAPDGSLNNVPNATSPFVLTGLTENGVYTFVVTDSLGCEGSSEVELDCCYLSFETEVTPVVCETPGQICVVNISRGTPNYEISWDGPVSGTVNTADTAYCIDSLQAGDYIITVTDSVGCSVTDTVTVDSLSELTFLTKPIDRVCETPGSIEISNITGTAVFDIEWSGPISGMDTTSNTFYVIDSLVQGTYIITLTDANGCTGMDTVMVDSLGRVPFTTEVTPVICEVPGEICVTVDGGSPDFEVTLSGPVSDTDTVTMVGGTTCFSDLPAGEYIISVVDANGCMGTDTVTVDSLNVLEFTATAHDGLCGDSAYIDVSILEGMAPFNIMWSGPESGMVDIDDNDYRIDVTQSGDYTIKVTDSKGCMRDTTVTVIVSPPKEITAEAVDATCETPGKINVTIVSGTAPCTISWDGPASGSTTTSADTLCIPDLSPGTYTVVAVDSFQCADTVTVTIDGPEEVAVDIESMPQMCEQLGSITLTYVTGNGPIVCSVAGPQIFTDVTLNGPGDTETLDDLIAGKYVIECIDSLGCTGLDTIIILENIDVLEFTASGNNSECAASPGSIDIEITEGMSPFTIEWTGPPSGSVTIDDNMYTIADLPSGEYFIKVTDSKGCMRDTTVIIDIGVPVNYDVEVIDITCDDPAGAIIINNITGTPDYSITVTGPGVDTTFASTGGPDTLGGLTQQGTYMIFVDDSIGCDGDTTVELGGPDEVIISVDPTDMICDTPGNMKFTYDCGFGAATITVIAPDGTTKEFVLENPGDMFTCEDLTEGDYEVIVIDEGDNTFETIITIDRVITEINVTITASSLSILPDGSVDIQVIVDPPGDYTYSWDITDPQFIDDPDSPNPTFTPCKTRTYTVTVVDVNNCSGQASITIEVPPVCIEPYIYIPNAFAPNGNDRNELFRIRSSFLEELQLVTFIIYDRWGEEVFKATDVKQGWDGTFRGEECPPDVFGYYLDVVCPDGNHFIRKGNVTLFR